MKQMPPGSRLREKPSQTTSQELQRQPSAVQCEQTQCVGLKAQGHTTPVVPQPLLCTHQWLWACQGGGSLSSVSPEKEGQGIGPYSSGDWGAAKPHCSSLLVSFLYLC